MKTYRVNEIFYSLQGEGRWVGRPALFIRMSGCNLSCSFCDTDFKTYQELGTDDILEQLTHLSADCKLIVLTGGEPTLQVDEHLTSFLHLNGYYISMETNGTHPIPTGIDWVTCSPKSLFIESAKTVIKKVSELKVVLDGKHSITDCGIEADYYYVQPCDVGDKKKNEAILQQAITFVKLNPKWQLSLQQHKIINIQ